MSYGIEIKNSNGNVLIDEKYPNYYLDTASPNTASPGATYPPSGTVSGDLIFARPPSNQSKAVNIAKGSPSVWDNDSTPDSFQIYPGSPTSYSYYRAKKYSDLTIPSTGYGMQIYGATNELHYTVGQSEKEIQLVAVGQWSRFYKITFPSNTGVYTDLDKYYCLMNTTNHEAFSNAFFAYDYVNAYQYEWVTATTGRIHVLSQWVDYDESSNDFNASPGLGYAIMKVVG